MQGRQWRVWSGVLAIGLLSLPLAAQSAREVRADYAQIRPFIQSFEVAINKAISSTFTNPFALGQKPKGAYLPGYGYSFTFLVNVSRGMITPFGMYKGDSEITPEQKRQRIEGLKEQLMHVLLAAGNGLTKLQKEESVSIVAFIEDRDPLNPELDSSKTIILTIGKTDLDDAAGRQDRFNEFKQKVKIVEY